MLFKNECCKLRSLWKQISSLEIRAPGQFWEHSGSMLLKLRKENRSWRGRSWVSVVPNKGLQTSLLLSWATQWSVLDVGSSRKGTELWRRQMTEGNSWENWELFISSDGMFTMASGSVSIHLRDLYRGTGRIKETDKEWLSSWRLPTVGNVTTPPPERIRKGTVPTNLIRESRMRDNLAVAMNTSLQNYGLGGKTRVINTSTLFIFPLLFH